MELTSAMKRILWAGIVGRFSSIFSSLFRKLKVWVLLAQPLSDKISKNAIKNNIAKFAFLRLLAGVFGGFCIECELCGAFVVCGSVLIIKQAQNIGDFNRFIKLPFSENF